MGAAFGFTEVGEAHPGGATPDAGVSSRGWHAMGADSVMEELGTVPEGLSTGEAESRAQQFGPNSLQPPRRVSAWEILLNQFRSVVMLLLVGAGALAFALGDPVDAVAIATVLVINAAVGFGTELKARGAVAALLRMEVPRAIVLRDGSAKHVDAQVLVPGDVVVVEAGQSVPADARLFAAAELKVNEAPLTGESVPVHKDPAAELSADAALADRINMLYMSTAVVAGSGRAVVIATGMRTELGRIGGLVGEIRQERTPLEHRLDALGHRLVWLALAVTGVVVLVGRVRGEPLGHMLETGLALAIAAVPEGLPAVSTIALAVGVARMARRKALVRRLPAVEALGSATVVCTDKTGTLTAGEMTVTTLWTAGREYGFSGVGYDPAGEVLLEGGVAKAAGDEVLRNALRIGALNNRATLTEGEGGWVVRGDPTEAALLVAARKGGLDESDLRSAWPESAELPFSSERMFMATFHDDGTGSVVFAKGAPARLLERCSEILTPQGHAPLDDAQREGVLQQNQRMAGRGLRVLALAEGKAGDTGERAVDDLTFVGLVGMSDPPAAGVRETIDRFRTAGIRTLMITGDQRLTAAAVARELGIGGEGDDVLEGGDLRGLTPVEMAERLPHIAALSRVTPEDKLRIVEALQQSGEIVAMLGDGVNDAAALKKSDIGVAMGTRGTDVAKEAAAVVLQDDRFQTIGAAVEEGRVIFDNIRKFVFYLFSCNLAEVLVILGAGLAGLPLPLLPLQILWLNLVTDTFPALSLAIEPAQRNVMSRPPRDPDEAILSPFFVRAILLYGGLITAATLTAYLIALRGPTPDAARATTVAFMTLALAQTFHLGNARDVDPVVRWSRAISNRWAVAAVMLTVSLQLFAVYFPPLAGVLDVVPLRPADWLLVVPFAVLPAVAGQLLAWRRMRIREARGHVA